MVDDVINRPDGLPPDDRIEILLKLLVTEVVQIGDRLRMMIGYVCIAAGVITGVILMHVVIWLAGLIW